MNRIRIASLFPRLHYGGDSTRVLHFARTIDRDRFEHMIVLLAPPTDAHDTTIGPMVAEYRAHDVRIEILNEIPRSEWTGLPPPLSTLRDAVGFARITARLAHFFRRHRIDVLDLRGCRNAVIGAVAGRLAGVGAAITTEYILDEWKSGIGPVLGRHLFRLIDAMITDSHVRSRNFEVHFPRSRGRIFVVPNGIHPPETSLTRDEARAKMGIPFEPGTPVFAQISRLLPFKGQAVLLRAAREVLTAVPSAFFLLCGYAAENDAYERELVMLAADLGITEHVRIGGYPGPVGDVFAATDVLVHPSLYDSSPISILESMAAGIPSVVSSAGGIPELVTDGETCLMVPPGDEKALAAAMRRVIRDPGLRDRLATGAKNRYLERHRPETMTRNIEKIITDILHGKGRQDQQFPHRRGDREVS